MDKRHTRGDGKAVGPEVEQHGASRTNLSVEAKIEVQSEVDGLWCRKFNWQLLFRERGYGTRVVVVLRPECAFAVGGKGVVVIWALTGGGGDLDEVPIAIGQETGPAHSPAAVISITISEKNAGKIAQPRCAARPRERQGRWVIISYTSSCSTGFCAIRVCNTGGISL